ncbi:CAZyme family AA7 [Trichoderma aggressivum f. europaeum]|uniref:CAZyme family AA7 n=1 Tax=Trichoderma aggressivum f. europaeum TaxID=173218 RepID=A0AAE1I8V7_9HYPO|nr:CAZyme family AA7 [Trichoderma aggressivum f. europaeum]
MLTRLLALATVAPGLVVYGKAPGRGACTLEELYEPWVSPATEIASSTEANFSTVIGPRWSAWEAPRWSGAIKPATEADLQKIVKISVENNIPFIATNGGHGPKKGQGSFTGINVNLASFNTVKIDTTNNLVTVGAGVKLWDVQTGLYNVGKEIQTGNSICPGAIGVTIGAGVGMMTGMYGLMIDTLKSVRMVTAKGQLVKASAMENRDLFWAIRGAGVNFGIVTEATYGIHDQTNEGNVTAVTFVYAAASNRTLWRTMKTFDGNQPAKLSFQTVIQFNRASNATNIVVQLWYFGPVSEAQPYIDKFVAVGPVVQSVTYLPQTDLYYQSETAGVCDRGHIISAHSLGFNQTDVASYEAHFADMAAFYISNPSFAGISVFQYYSNKKTLQTPASETVFPWRDIQIWWLTQNQYTDASLGPQVDRFMRGQRTNLQITSGFPTPHVYFNYAFGDEGAAAWYSAANLPKLRKLKAIWDPNFVFGNGAPLY